MEVQYRASNGKLVFKLTGTTTKELFEEIASIQDTFEAETSCGHCGSLDIKFQKRLAGDKDEFDYYELVCKNLECRARFSFGQSKDKKTLFPKRKDQDGNWLPNRGWDKYVKPEPTGFSGRTR
jgi:hypothetical protein